MCHDLGVSGLPHKSGQCGDDETPAQYKPHIIQKVDALWEWQHEKGWLPYDAKICNQLEKAWESRTPRYCCSVENNNYVINFEHMWQQNCQYRTTRQIRRNTVNEGPAWYWWNDSGGRFRMSASASLMLETAYNQLISSGQHSDVKWKSESGDPFTLNVETMRLTDNFGQQYPMSRSVIQSNTIIDVDSSGETTASTQGGQPRTKTYREGDGNPHKTQTEHCKPEENGEAPAEASIRILFQGTTVGIQVAQGSSASIHVSASQQQQQSQIGQQSRNNIVVNMNSSSGFGIQDDGSTCRSSSTVSCCGSRRVKQSARQRRCGSCCSNNSTRSCCSCCSNRKPLCNTSANAIVLECLRRDEADFMRESETESSVGGVDERTEEDQAPQQHRAAAAVPAQAQQQESHTAPAETEQQLQQQALEEQHTQILLRQEEQLQMHVRLEHQQQLLHQQHHELVFKLQQKQDELLQKHEEVREQQSQLEQQHEQQRQLLQLQAEHVQQLQSLAQTAQAAKPEKPLLKGSMTSQDEASQHEIPLVQTPSGPGEFQSPLLTDDDDYTCL